MTWSVRLEPLTANPITFAATCPVCRRRSRIQPERFGLTFDDQLRPSTTKPLICPTLQCRLRVLIIAGIAHDLDDIEARQDRRR